MSYRDKLYAASLAEFGHPLELPCSGGWLIKRAIPGSTSFDAMGPYPIFSCRDWSGLGRDMEVLGEGVVCVSLVTDPFGNYTTDMLRECFPHKMVPFKEHFVIDLARGDYRLNSHHKRNARKALAALEIEVCTQPAHWLDDWAGLYQVLVARHDIKGIPAFSKASFEKQLSLCGTTAIKASLDGETVGMLIWYRQGEVAYYHLGAYKQRGYETKASFALFSVAIEHFRAMGVRHLSLGAGAGLDNAADDGLTRFKRGWSTATRTVYLCGRIFDASAYERMAVEKSLTGTSYFPAYRMGELF